MRVLGVEFLGVGLFSKSHVLKPKSRINGQPERIAPFQQDILMALSATNVKT